MIWPTTRGRLLWKKSTPGIYFYLIKIMFSFCSSFLFCSISSAEFPPVEVIQLGEGVCGEGEGLGEEVEEERTEARAVPDHRSL